MKKCKSLTHNCDGEAELKKDEKSIVWEKKINEWPNKEKSRRKENKNKIEQQ